jgi:hypothetical protein
MGLLTYVRTDTDSIIPLTTIRGEIMRINMHLTTDPQYMYLWD